VESTFRFHSGRIRAAEVHQCEDIPAPAAELAPCPAQPFLGADKRPEFIDIQITHADWDSRSPTSAAA